MEMIRGKDIEKYISRCVACQTKTSVAAFHSQDHDIPGCPNNWEPMWNGWSFVMFTGAGASGGGQSLQSPGSCLENFRATPFVECHGRGTCNYFGTAFSFWLAIIEDADQFRKP